MQMGYTAVSFTGAGDDLRSFRLWGRAHSPGPLDTFIRDATEQSVKIDCIIPPSLVISRRGCRYTCSTRSSRQQRLTPSSQTGCSPTSCHGPFAPPRREDGDWGLRSEAVVLFWTFLMHTRTCPRTNLSGQPFPFTAPPVRKSGQALPCLFLAPDSTLGRKFASLVPWRPRRPRCRVAITHPASQAAGPALDVLSCSYLQ
jgi:hypothetical protein